jgi:hypothetical protein
MLLSASVKPPRLAGGDSGQVLQIRDRTAENFQEQGKKLGILLSDGANREMLPKFRKNCLQNRESTGSLWKSHKTRMNIAPAWGHVPKSQPAGI